MRALDGLLAARAPKLHAHLCAEGFDVSLVATDWFLCLFGTTLPPETAARVWDALLAEGGKVLHRVALALLAAAEPALRSRSNPGEMLKAVKDAARQTHDREGLMAAAFRQRGLSRKALGALRARAAAGVVEMVKQREQSLAARETGRQAAAAALPPPAAAAAATAAAAVQRSRGSQEAPARPQPLLNDVSAVPEPAAASVPEPAAASTRATGEGAGARGTRRPSRTSADVLAPRSGGGAWIAPAVPGVPGAAAESEWPPGALPGALPSASTPA